MAILEMKKIRVMIHCDVAVKSIKAIQRAGVLELTEITKNNSLNKSEKNNFHLNYLSSRLDFVASFLSKYQNQGLLKTIFEEDSITSSEEEIKKLANSFYYIDIINSAYDIVEKINIAEGKIIELKKEEEILKSWENLPIILSEPNETKYTKTIFLRGKPEIVKKAHKNLDKIKNVAPSIISDTSLTVTYLKNLEKEITVAIKNFDLTTVTLPNRRGTPKEELERIKRAEKKTIQKLDILDSEAKRLSKDLPKIKIMSDYIRWRMNRHDLISESHGTEKTIILEGWCPSQKIKSLESKIKKVSHFYSLTTLSTKENPPTCIQNSKFTEAFEPITYLYGVPTSRDVDPTPFLAGFFFIFFGFCLSDVGYGIILTLITTLILLIYNVPREKALFLKLLFLSGVSSFLAGTIFGGYMGINISTLPEWQQKLNIFNPLENPMPIFFLALILGFIQILVGLILAIIREYRNGNFIEGILTKGPWITFLLSLVLWAGTKFNYIPAITEKIWFILIYSSLILIVLTGGYHQKNIFSKLAMGFASLYEIVGYLSDTLSYSRLLAIGLATSALAFSINLLAMIAYDSIPYIGWIFFILIVVIGHSFNFIVNLLGAFIHTARLQFVEFFSKFIIGTGRVFKPFSRESKHVMIINKKVINN